MSWLRVYTGEAQRELAYRLHLLGLKGGQLEVMPGYLRAEEHLRRAARVKFPELPGWTSVSEALSAKDVSRADWAWFERRQALGEGQEGPALAAAAMVLMPEWRPPRAEGRPIGQGAVGLVVSTALRPLPAFAHQVVRPFGEAGSSVMAVGPAVPPELLILGATALCLDEPLRERFVGLSPATRQFGTLMAAGTAFLALDPPTPLLEAMLKVVVRDVLPPQHRADEVHAHIKRLAPLLDQPPGEVERTMHGLGRNRADRVHRAWLRGFFLPRGFELEKAETQGCDSDDDA